MTNMQPQSQILKMRYFGIILLVDCIFGELIWTGKSCDKLGLIEAYPGSCTSYAYCNKELQWEEHFCPPGFQNQHSMYTPEGHGVLGHCDYGECMPPPLPEVLGQPCDVAGSTEVLPYVCDAFAVCTLVMDSLIWVEEKCEPDSCPFVQPCPPIELKTVVVGEPCELQDEQGFIENECESFAYCNLVGDAMIWVEQPCGDDWEKVERIGDKIYCHTGLCTKKPWWP